MDRDFTETVGPPVDPERLKFITENLAALQGLNTAAMGACFFLFSMEDIWKFPWWADLLRSALAMVLCVAVARGLITKYYERRFGRVEHKPKSPTTRREAISSLISTALFVAALIAAFIWGHRLEVWATATLIGDRSGQIGLLALLFWIMWLLKNLRKRPSDPRGSLFYVIGSAITAMIVFYPKWHPEAIQSMFWRTLNTGSIWLTMIAIGLRDHFVLVRFLPNQTGDDDDEC